MKYTFFFHIDDVKQRIIVYSKIDWIATEIFLYGNTEYVTKN